MARPLLLSCQAVSKAFGTRSLFDDLSFGLLEGDQAGLVGPNGSGKSTLLKILVGLETPDRGTRSLRGGVRVGYVPQDPVFPAARHRRRRGAGGAGRRRRRRSAQSPGARRSAGPASPTDARRSTRCRAAGASAWRSRASWRRAPDILLMDEPTNHLDVDGILWLEGLLAERARACLVVSHDRYFLEHVATRMLELNRAYPDGLFEAQGTLQRVPGAPRRLPARAGGLPGVAGQHACGGRSSGCAAAPRRARPRPRGASRRRSGSSTSWPRAARAALSATAGIDFTVVAASDAPAGRRARRDQVARRPRARRAASTSSSPRARASA